LNSWHKQSSQMYTCNPSAGGCAWAACGKSLVSKQTALGTRDSSVKKYAGSAMTRFPTGCAGPWKTLVLIRWRPSHDDARAKPNLTDKDGEFPTALASRSRLPATTATAFPLQLSKFRIGGAYRPSSDFEQASVLCHGSYAPQVFNQAALVPPRMPRGDFSAWAFLIVAGVHF
jgi:hypothetical protein